MPKSLDIPRIAGILIGQTRRARTQRLHRTIKIREGNPMSRRMILPLLTAGFVLALGVAPVAAQKQTLHMAYWAGPSHHMVKTQEAWIKTIEAASGGNLTVEVDKAPLAKPNGQYDLVKNGVRDMVWHVARLHARPVRHVAGRRACRSFAPTPPSAPRRCGSGMPSTILPRRNSPTPSCWWPSCTARAAFIPSRR